MKYLPLLLLVALMVACGARPTSDQKSRSPTVPADATSEKPNARPGEPNPIQPLRQHAFGERVSCGDLRITVVEAHSGQFAGQYRGRFTPVNLLLVRLSVENTSGGKIADWPGWQGKGKVEDEHGNVFKPVSLTGWSCLPNNNTLGDGWDGDFATRIHPSKVYENAAYYEYAPPTSKQAVITFPLGGELIQFRGPFGVKDQLDRERALKAKQGMVLDAAELITAIRAGKSDIATAFPIGCTMKATGVVRRKDDQTKTRSDLKHIPYMIWISYEPEKPINSSASAICYTKDKGLYDRVMVGSTVSLRGILRFIPERGSPTTPIQAHLHDCAQIE